MKRIITLAALLTATATTAHADPVYQCAAELSCCTGDECKTSLVQCIDAAAEPNEMKRQMEALTAAMERIQRGERDVCAEYYGPMRVNGLAQAN